MMIRLNGAFGARKTQMAYALRCRLPGPHVYDSENAGYFLRANLPPAMPPTTFRTFPLWRALTVAILRSLAEQHPGRLIIPMTVVNRAYRSEIIGTLSQEYDPWHLILCASQETIRKRLASRLEGRRSWACSKWSAAFGPLRRTSRSASSTPTDLPIGEAGQRVREMTGLSLTGDRRSGPRRRADQLAVQLRSIRLSELLPPLQGRSGFLLPVSLFPEYFLPCIVP